MDGMARVETRGLCQPVLRVATGRPGLLWWDEAPAPLPPV